METNGSHQKLLSECAKLLGIPSKEVKSTQLLMNATVVDLMTDKEVLQLKNGDLIKVVSNNTISPSSNSNNESNTPLERPTSKDDYPYCCPITGEIMKEPVVAADGYSYEKQAILEWLSKNNTSPMTLLPLPHKNLTANYALQSLIKEHLQKEKK